MSTHIYRTAVELNCGKRGYICHDIEVTYEWQPYEKPTRDYPGCRASADIYEAYLPDGQSCLARIEKQDLHRIEQEILEHEFNRGVDYRDWDER